MPKKISKKCVQNFSLQNFGYIPKTYFRTGTLVGAITLLFCETIQESKNIFAGLPSLGPEITKKVSKKALK